VVTAIAGIERVLATFVGRADHAGTTPMEVRHDALVAAAKAVLTVEREGCGAPVHGVCTSGRLETYPGSPNVVPEQVRLWAEFRSIDAEWLAGVRGRVTEQIARQASENGVHAMLDWVNNNSVVSTHQGLQNVTAQTAEGMGCAWAPVPSGATHDAVHLSRLCPTGMIFVPSTDGRSHCRYLKSE
jgi:N-carbamoyl-L-amino-acid hydrolase